MQPNIHADKECKAQYRDHLVGPQPFNSINLPTKNVYYFITYIKTLKAHRNLRG